MRILVSGTFDDLHPGHLFVISEAAKRGELWVIVARDSNVMKIKGHAPLQNEQERIAAIQKEFPAAHVVLGDDRDFLKPVREIAPDLILLGYDQKLPPDVKEEDLPCPIERLSAFHPEVYKSSLRREKEQS
jgi:FAD synthetase